MAKKRKRKNKTAAAKQKPQFGEARQLGLAIGVPEIQESTCQVPVGESSIWHAARKREIAVGAVAVYLVLNHFSNWESGWTHHLAYSEIEKRMGNQMPHATIVHHINSLIEKGWIAEKKAHKDKNKGNTYRLIHHNCNPFLAPTDKDGLPKKCAMPTGAGSVYEKLENQEIGWQAFVYWQLLKMLSDWKTGIVSLTYAETQEWLKFGPKTISTIKQEIESAGLFERISKPFQAFACQLFPKPYPTRRRRRHENPKSMKLIDGFYYSFNGKWRVRRTDGQIHTKMENGRWRHANERELESANKKIWKDFEPIIKLACSPAMQEFRKAAAAASGSVS